MTQYFNKDDPFFDSTTGEPLAFGIVYFGQPNTDPKDQVNNAKAPYEDREFTTPADSVQTLTIAGKLPDRLFLDGAYAITVTDADGVDISVNPYWAGDSSDTVINDSDVTGATVSAALDNLQAQINALIASSVTLAQIWPIGALYFTATNENPGSRLGFGTWTAEAEGRVLIGVGSGTDINGITDVFTQGQTGGEYNHELTESELVGHTHALFSNGTQAPSPSSIGADQVAAREFADSGNNDQYIIKPAATQSATTGLSSETGGSTPFPIVQPYIVRYIWRRTA